MTDKNIQDLDKVFIEQLCISETPITVFLINGVKLSGYINSYDKHLNPRCFTLMRDGLEQLVYSRAIATILPNETLGNR